VTGTIFTARLTTTSSVGCGSLVERKQNVLRDRRRQVRVGPPCARLDGRRHVHRHPSEVRVLVLDRVGDQAAPLADCTARSYCSAVILRRASGTELVRGIGLRSFPAALAAVVVAAR